MHPKTLVDQKLVIIIPETRAKLSQSEKKQRKIEIMMKD